jgi:hypothetical protein
VSERAVHAQQANTQQKRRAVSKPRAVSMCGSTKRVLSALRLTAKA